MSSEMTVPLKAFVIGPIGDKDASDGSSARVAYEEGIQVFEEVILPACTAFGVEVFRADMIPHSGEIPEQVFRQLRDCAVVIADLTGANPNVMYELGLRHTTGRMTIQIGEKGRLPFDIAAIRTIMFKRTDAGLVQARKDLSKTLAANLDQGGDPVTATRIWFESSSIQTASPISPVTEDDDDPTDEEPGFLELLAEMEIGTQSLSQTISAATTIVEEISAIYSESAELMRSSDARREGLSARLSIAEKTAKKLDESAARLEIISGEYARTVDRIEPGIHYLLTQLAEESNRLTEVPDFIGNIRSLCNSAQMSVNLALEMRKNALDMGAATRSLKRVGQRFAASFKRFADTSNRIGSWITLVDKIG